jgi:hypothetical protein
MPSLPRPWLSFNGRNVLPTGSSSCALQLDDELLETLKEDLIYAKKLAVDEDGRVLVWTGGISSAR